MLSARRRATVFVVSIFAALSLAVVSAAPAYARTATDRFVGDTNHARTNHSLHTYKVARDLKRIAQRWANHMAACRCVKHNPKLESQAGNWEYLGENVGQGGTEPRIQRAFMRSPPHRGNILDRDYTQVGIGTARGSNGAMYVDEVFRRPF